MNEKMKKQQLAEQYKKEMVGFRYRHFKGGVYLVTDIAVHSESDDLMVIYKSFDNTAYVWARPLEMFLSEVDHEKYPEVEQKMRFEKMSE